MYFACGWYSYSMFNAFKFRFNLHLIKYSKSMKLYLFYILNNTYLWYKLKKYLLVKTIQWSLVYLHGLMNTLTKISNNGQSNTYIVSGLLITQLWIDLYITYYNNFCHIEFIVIVPLDLNNQENNNITLNEHNWNIR